MQGKHTQELWTGCTQGATTVRAPPKATQSQRQAGQSTAWDAKEPACNAKRGSHEWEEGKKGWKAERALHGLPVSAAVDVGSAAATFSKALVWLA